MLSKKEKKDLSVQYAIKINEAIASIFDEDSDYFVDVNEFDDENKLKAFIHALSTVAPTNITNKLIGGENNWVEHNHLANSLCFEFIGEDK